MLKNTSRFLRNAETLGEINAREYLMHNIEIYLGQIYMRYIMEKSPTRLSMEAIQISFV